MEDRAYRQYHVESESWLKVGRRKLLSRQLRSATRGTGHLECLDVGAGVGQNVPALREFGEVDVVEINELGLEVLRTVPGIRSIFETPVPAPLDRKYDVIVATDVLEHIEDDAGAVKWIAQHLKPAGIFFSTVPAYQFHDVALHHFRRYNAPAYAALMEPYLAVERCGYFNSMLFPAAAILRIAGRMQLKRKPPGEHRKQSGIFPRPVDALFRSILGLEVEMIDRRLGLPFGLSVYCLARRGERSPALAD